MFNLILICFSKQKTDKPKKLETPLAAMLPSKYANVDVTELFPDFRPDKVKNYKYIPIIYVYFA